MRVLLVCCLLLVSCAPPERDALVGRYTVRGRLGEQWTLADDGSCRIDRTSGAETACEWEYRRGDEGTKVVVTVGAGPSPRRRYVLSPRRWPGRRVTLPLTAEATLEKVD